MDDSGGAFAAYIRDVIYSLRERAAEAHRLSKTTGADQAFQQGRALAYSEVLSHMQSQAEVFQLPADQLFLADFDPINGPFDPPKPAQ